MVTLLHDSNNQSVYSVTIQPFSVSYFLKRSLTTSSLLPGVYL